MRASIVGNIILFFQSLKHFGLARPEQNTKNTSAMLGALKK